MDERDRQIVAEFKRRISADVLSHVRRIIVFGSRATGKATEDSDLDIIVLVDEKTSGLENSLDDVAYDVMWDHEFKPIISLKVFTEARFKSSRERGFSFYKNVEREGVLV